MATLERPKKPRTKPAAEAPEIQEKINDVAVSDGTKISAPKTLSPAGTSAPEIKVSAFARPSGTVKYTYDALNVLFNSTTPAAEDIYPDSSSLAPEKNCEEEAAASTIPFANATAPAIEEEKETPSAAVAEDEEEAETPGRPSFPILPKNHVMMGPLKMYRLPPMSVAGLKSLLKMDAAIGLLLSVAMIIAFAVVGDKHRTLGIPLSPLTRASVGLAISAALASLLGCLLTLLMFFRYKHPSANGLISPKLVAAKFGAAACATVLSLLTCLLSAVSTETETNLGLLAFSSGVLSSPIYAVSFIMEFYALFVRPHLLARQGVVPMLDEDEDACCGEL